MSAGAGLVLRACWLGVLVVTAAAVYTRAPGDCRDEVWLDVGLALALAVSFGCAALNLKIFVLTRRGSVVRRASARAGVAVAVAWLLAISVGDAVCAAAAVVGAVFLLQDPALCASLVGSPLAPRDTVLRTLALANAAVSGSAMCVLLARCGCAPRNHAGRRNLVAHGEYDRGVHAEGWARVGRLWGCCCRHTHAPSAFEDVGAVLAASLAAVDALDLTPTDVAAGLALVREAQKEGERERVQAMVRRALAAGHSGAAPRRPRVRYHAHVLPRAIPFSPHVFPRAPGLVGAGSQRSMGSPRSVFSGTEGSGGAEPAEQPGALPSDALSVAAHFGRYALGMYGPLVYVRARAAARGSVRGGHTSVERRWRGIPARAVAFFPPLRRICAALASGAAASSATRASVGRCPRARAPPPRAAGGVHMPPAQAAMSLATGVKGDDVLYSSYVNAVACTPFAVIRDRATGASASWRIVAQRVKTHGWPRRSGDQHPRHALLGGSRNRPHGCVCADQARCVCKT